jgi:murein DD-endopeptidase MepM/ murein hydrolase activator NlpD
LNKFFTILFIPEKTNQVRKLIIPAAYLRVGLILGFLGCFFVAFMIYDYVNVMQQLAENRKLAIENRQLRQKIQSFSTKLTGVEESLERIQTFSTKLRIITNQGDEDTEVLKERAGKDIPGVPMDDHSVTPGTNINYQKRDKAPKPDEFTWIRDLADKTPLRFAELSIPTLDNEVEKAIHSLPPAPSSATQALPKGSIATGADEKKTTQPIASKSKIKISDLLKNEEDVSVDVALEKEFDRLYIAFQEILKLSRDVEVDIQDLASTLLDQKDYLLSMPTLKPSNGWYTSGFGMRSSPYTGLPTMHEGLDIANHYGQPIIAPAEGIISFAGARPGYGKLITIDHGYGLQTQYGHISKFYVKEGDRVRRGQKISAVGNTGRSTGPHLHYEVRVNGIPVDPYFYILND